MVAVPTDTPVTTPLVPTDAIAGLLLLHTPPGVRSVKLEVDPRQILGDPVIGDIGFTVMVVVLKHPLGNVYEMTGFPPETPVTTPVVDPTEATNGLLLVQVPPLVTSLKLSVIPGQIEPVFPVMAAGEVLTTTACVT